MPETHAKSATGQTEGRMTLQDWKQFPPMLRCDDLTRIYPYTLLTIRKMVQHRNRKVPTPCGRRPFVFRRDDVKRHYERVVS
jgi:hypothetical protein